MRRRGGDGEEKDQPQQQQAKKATGKSRTKKTKRRDGLQVLCSWLLYAAIAAAVLVALAIGSLTVALRTLDHTLAEDQRDKEPPPTPNSYRCCIQSDNDREELGDGNITPADIAKRLKYDYRAADIAVCKEGTSTRCLTLSPDPRTMGFLEYIVPRAKGKVSSVGYKLVERAFSLSRDDTNSVMHLLRGLDSELYMASQAQWRVLLGIGPNEVLPAGLDIGAGHGDLAYEMKPMFSEMYATEVSWVMRTVLSAHGFTSIKSSRATPKSVGRRDFDVVFALNVLDRCNDPWDLMAQLARLIKPSGKVVISIPIPYYGFTKLPLRMARGWEPGMETLINDFLIPGGFKVEAIARAPYLCQGIAKSLDPVFVYDAGILVLSLNPGTAEAYETEYYDDDEQSDDEYYADQSYYDGSEDDDDDDVDDDDDDDDDDVDDADGDDDELSEEPAAATETNTDAKPASGDSSAQPPKTA